MKPRLRRVAVCALAPEARTLAGAPLMTAICGPGLAALADAGQLAATVCWLRTLGADAVVSWGVAGALDPNLSAGSVCIPSRVVDEQGRSLPCDPTILGPAYRPAGVLVTVERAVLTPASRAELYRRTQADVVDMESFRLARAAHSLGIPFAAVRAVSDECGDVIPAWLAGVMTPTGGLRLRVLAGNLLARPGDISALLRLQRSFGAACAALRRQVPTIAPAWSPL